MKIKILIIISILFCSSKCISQNKKIDSLKFLSKSQNGKQKFKTLLQISEIYSRINLDSSNLYTKKAFEISKEINNDSLKMKALMSLGFRSFESGDYSRAIKNFEKALPISFTLKDSTSIADIYNGFAITYSKHGDLKKSIEYNFKTLSIYEKIKDSLGVANSYLNIGWDYRKLKEYKKSLKYNFKSLEIYKKIKNSLRVAMANNNIAGTQNELGQYKKAIKYSNKSKEYFLKLNFERYTAYPISVMAIAYDSLHNYKLAKKNYLKAIKLHTKNREPYELAFLNYSLANLYYKQEKYTEALFTAKKAFSFAKEVNAKEYIVDISKILAKLYEKKNENKLSNKYLKLFIKYNDSILNDEKIKSIAEIETKYETAKKEKEIAQQKELLLEQELAIKNRNLYAFILSSVLLILGIIFWGIYKKNQFKRKQLQKEIDLKDALATIKTQNRLQEQRLRISRDLHDNIGSQLTFIISSVDNLKYITKGVNDKLIEKLSGISSFTSQTIHELRDTIWAMNKSEVSVEDLHTRILSFVEKAKNTYQNIEFEVNYNIDKNMSFSSLVGMNIFRVIQEAINNSLKYAEATKIEVQLQKNNNFFEAIIKDNGNGFDLKSIELGNGLSNMEKRMSEINGKVKIESEEKKGTKISLSISLKNTSKDL
ncbi:tetratricopeptide repeat protein [Polaribacter sp. Hel1_85]|uniref:tetratricopeptide repeat-containing sensor histidine kinase n=1 Tax=Polaribacter sp. Hel1_85 TaxID=1250005 RepID=UPI00052CA8F8|nr:tetratricopeptide repeat protein [Polaribacter sp. Hel1_85]KGL61954.1 two-component system sensor histidine kinase [Polaribacter sp. Hel1_85]